MTTTRGTRTAWPLAILVSVAAITLAACGGSDEPDPEPRVARPADPAVRHVADDVFAQQNADVIKMVDRAAGDFCIVGSSNPRHIAAPADLAQAQLLSDTFSAWFAAVSPGLTPDELDALGAAQGRLVESTVADGFDPDAPVLHAAGPHAVLEAFDERVAAECTVTSTTTMEPPPGTP